MCTVSMLLPVIIGSATAATSVMGSMSAMSRTSSDLQPSGYWAIINAINFVGQPLLIASIALIMYEMKNFGRLPITLAAVGGSLLYAGMNMLNMSIPLIVVSAGILAISYAIAYVPFIVKSEKARKSPAHRPVG